MAIEVIREKVEMPKTNERRFRYTCNNGNIDSYWYVYDTGNKNGRVSKGKFNDMAFRCMCLNKIHYRALANEA